MSAKSLGTLPVIYVVDEQHNPIPRKTMVCGGDTNSTGGENDVFPSSLGLRLSIQHCITGEGGSQLLFLERKKDGVENSYNVCQKYLERLYSFKNFLPPSCFRGINENVHPLSPLIQCWISSQGP